MTWGEIQIESLKKMFLNSDDLSISKLDEYKTEKKYKTYLFAMPQACNEAINYISNLIPIIKSYELTVEKERYDLSELISDYKCIDNIVCAKKWTMESNNILKVDKKAGNIIIYYEAYPQIIEATTSSDTNLVIDKDCLRYIPLYIAGELYKDDDLTLSTMYMNEFVNNIDLQSNKMKSPINNVIIPVYKMD